MLFKEKDNGNDAKQKNQWTAQWLYTLYISLPFYVNEQREMTKFCVV